MSNAPRGTTADQDGRAVPADRRRTPTSRGRRAAMGVAAAAVAVLALTSACDSGTDGTDDPTSSPAAAPTGGPANMLSDGAVFVGQSGAISVRPTAALAEGAKPVATQTLRDGGLIDVVLYLDYRSPEAATFWSTSSPMLEEWLSGGHVTFEVHPVAVLDEGTSTTAPADASTPAVTPQPGDYSARAAGAFACVAASDPDHAYDVNAALLEAQPDLPEEGLTTDALLELVAGAGATGDDVASCIQHGDWTDWAAQATARAQESVPFDNVPALDVPMRLLIGGVPYPGELDSGQQFFTFMAQTYNGIMAAAQQKALENQGGAPSPTATPGG